GTRIAQLVSKKGIKVDLQISSNKEEDLNGAGRWAKSKNPDIYLSVHHNAYKDDLEGYFFMVNDKDYVSDKYAKQLSNSIVDNPLGIPQMKNRINDGYIGEINEFKDTDTITILGEFGFFSSEKELVKIINDEQVEYVANQIADQLENILNSL
ncbi:MAG: N-acetylmuramoyl-L-alanine amidase, partial [Bacilli bacterium]